MSENHSSDPPTTPQRTWTTLSSYSRPDSYSSEDTSSERNMRRIILSPAATDYDDDDTSLNDSAEVEAALAALDDEIDTTENALTEWSSNTLDPFNFHPRALSMIAERTEEGQSRPTSFRTSTFGPPRPFTPVSAANPSSEILGLAREAPGPRSLTPSSLTSSSSHSRSPTDPISRNPSPERSLRHTPGRRAGDLIAFFEDRSSGSSSSLSSFGQVRSTTSRSPTTTFTPSQSLPTLSRVVTEAPSLSQSSFPQSTTLPTLDSRSGSPTKASAASMSSFMSPIRSVESRTAAPTLASPTKQLPRVPGGPRSPLSSVRNIVAAWKERTPSLGKSSNPPSTTSGPGDEGFFSIRRRDVVDTDRSLPALPGEPLSRKSSNGNGGGNGNGRKSGTSVASGSKTPFDIAELGPFAQSDRDPLRIGKMWYLNVHGQPPYRWLRTQAILYPHVLILSWIAPGGGRGVITLDLLNCNEVRSVPSPSHPSANDDIGTIAAREQAGASGAEGNLVETLCPFQLLYPDGVERLGAESARERVRWVGAIWEALNRAVTFPDPSVRSRSPAPSIRTIRSESSSGSSGANKSRSGSASTVFVPPLDTIPDISSSSSASSRSSIVGGLPVPSHASLDDAGFRHLRASDDGAISDGGILYPLERSGSKVIAPSRSSSLRRTSSLADLDAEFASAVSRSAHSSAGKPVTVSSGPSSTDDVFVSPPPSTGKKSKGSSTAKSTSDSGDSGAYLTPPSRAFVSPRRCPQILRQML
ncbi:hypothetical protein K439DRAFT_341186 [Ramaria rubella]|nr:hypothetical protein K439DRAFT_341186 [Ramaria rubella]